MGVMIYIYIYIYINLRTLNYMGAINIFLIMESRALGRALGGP